MEFLWVFFLSRCLYVVGAAAAVVSVVVAVVIELVAEFEIG